jgi:hypothetical protein
MKKSLKKRPCKSLFGPYSRSCKKLKTLKRYKSRNISKINSKKKKSNKNSMVFSSKKLSVLSGGFKLNEVNETGNNGFITSCIPCCSSSDCPNTDKSGNVSIVTKIFFNTTEGTVKYLKEVEIGNRLQKIDPNQNRFIFSLPKSSNCSTCTTKVKQLDPSIQKVLRKVNPLTTEDDTISNFKSFNMMAVNNYENVTAIPEYKKDFLKESLQILHANGICHLDLHKLNIMEGADLYPRIIDFGESYIFDPTNVTEIDIENMKKDRTTLSTTLLKTPKDIDKQRRSLKRRSSLEASPRQSFSPSPGPRFSPSQSKLFEVRQNSFENIENINFGLSPSRIRYNSPDRKFIKYDSPPTRSPISNLKF